MGMRKRRKRGDVCREKRRRSSGGSDAGLVANMMTAGARVGAGFDFRLIVESRKDEAVAIVRFVTRV